MTTATNKAITLQLFERLTAGDIPGVLELLSDDATWWIAGKPERSPVAGLYSKEQVARLLERMAAALEHGLEMEVQSVIAEGDQVAAEVVSRGDLRNGRQYRQEYHMLLSFSDGKVISVREYLDTHHVWEVWVVPPTDEELRVSSSR